MTNDFLFSELRNMVIVILIILIAAVFCIIFKVVRAIYNKHAMEANINMRTTSTDDQNAML